MAIITNFSDLDLTKQYSYADYMLWQFSERVELIKGFIMKMSPAPAKKHQVISRKLTRYIDRYFEDKPCGFFVAPFDVRLVNHKKSTPDNQVFTVLQPDLCVVCDLEKLDERGCNGSPDLVIEILSPGNSKKEMKYKLDLYEESGVLEYWIVNPQDKNIFIFVLENNKFVVQHPLIDEDKIKSVLFPQLDFLLEDIF